MATNAAVDAINATASNGRVRLAMLMGAKLESGWNPGAVGDGGTSFGIFQIHLPAHPNVTAEQAKDPAFAARFMLPAYEAGASRVDPALWNADPALAAATAAFYAERPKAMYPSDRVRGAWSAVNGAMTGNVTDDTGGVQNVSNPLDAIGQGFDDMWKAIWWPIYDLFGAVTNKIYYVLLVGGGGLTIAVGLFLLLHNSSAARTLGTVGSAYRTVGTLGLRKGS